MSSEMETENISLFIIHEERKDDYEENDKDDLVFVDHCNVGYPVSCICNRH